MLPIKSLNSFPLIDDSEEPSHGSPDLLETLVAVELVFELEGVEVVRLELISLLQKDVPELMQGLMVLQSQLGSPPSSAYLGGLGVCELVQVFVLSCSHFVEHFANGGPSHHSKVVPINGH